MNTVQAGILSAPPRSARYLFFSLRADCDASEPLQQLAEKTNGEDCVVGLSSSLVVNLGAKIEGLKTFPASSGGAVDVPSTPVSLWCWIRGEDRGDLVHAGRKLEKLLLPAFDLIKVIDAFQYRDSRDLSGYEDGTENPEDEAAVKAAVVQGCGDGLDGGSFVAVQQWLHDLDYMESMAEKEMDEVIGRRLTDNEELDDAPASAHVKRTAQEDFEPEAFVLRRSMPWADEAGEGLVFVAFGHSFYAFEALLKRMTGADDGIVDALFRVSQPLTGAYFWCPPVLNGQLDLRALNL